MPPLNFRFFDASSGNVYSVTPADGTTYKFQQDAIVGSDANPVVLQNSYYNVQKLKLKKGWNWVSFYVVPKEGTTLGQFLNSMSKWEADDRISAVNGTKTASTRRATRPSIWKVNSTAAKSPYIRTGTA